MKNDAPHPYVIPKRVRSASIHDTLDTPSAQYLKSSVASVDAAISAGANSVLPQLIIRDISKLSYPAVHRAVKALVRAREWRPVIDVYDTMYSSQNMRMRFTPRLYTDLMFALMKIGTKQAAWKAYSEWQKLVNEGADSILMSPRAYNLAFVLLSRAGLLDEAIQVRTNCIANGFYINRFSYNAFLNACAKLNQIEEAFETLKEMADSNIFPDVISFNVLITCCVRSGDLDIALGILLRMRDWGMSPDVYSYNSLINGLGKHKMLDEAFELVAQMEIDAADGRPVSLITDIPRTDFSKRGDSLDINEPAPSNGLTSEESVNRRIGREKVAPLIKALVSSRQLLNREIGHDKQTQMQNAESINNGLEEKTNSYNDEDEEDGEYLEDTPSRASISPDVVTYNTLLSGIATSDKPDLARALGVKEHMEKRGVVCNEVSYNSLMAVAARANLVEGAFHIYEEMVAFGLKPSCECFTTLIAMCGRAKLINRAFQTHDHMIASGIKPSVISFNALLMACKGTSSRDTGDAALKILKRMRETSGCKPDVITYSTVIDALGRSGRFSKVSEVLDEMSREGIEPNLVTYTSVVSALSKAGDLNGAMRVLEDMERHGIKPNVYTFSSLIHGAGRTGEFARAFEVLGMMRERKIVASQITYCMLLQMAFNCGKRTFLEDVVNALSDDVRLKGTQQLKIIAELSKSRDLFSPSKRRGVFRKMSEAVRHCVPLNRSELDKRGLMPRVASR